MFSQQIVGKSLGDAEQPVVMSYDENNPLAITFAFAQGQTFVDWIFARDLLIETFQDGIAGIGDIRFVFDPKKEIIAMKIASPNGEATIIFPSEEISIFLEQTTKMVAVGEEEKYLNIDEEWEIFSQEEDQI